MRAEKDSVYAIAVAVLNMDGKLDMVFGNDNTPSMTLMNNAMAAVFQARVLAMAKARSMVWRSATSRQMVAPTLWLRVPTPAASSRSTPAINKYYRHPRIRLIWHIPPFDYRFNEIYRGRFF